MESMDEFAEVHTKDLVVREHLSGIIPCAGVSACFGRNALAILADLNRGEAFRTNSFTEDYDIAFRVHDLGLRTTFASYQWQHDRYDRADGAHQRRQVRRGVSSYSSGGSTTKKKTLDARYRVSGLRGGWRGNLGTDIFWRAPNRCHRARGNLGYSCLPPC
jgi:hypothetical protein